MQVLQDYGTTYGTGNATHSLTLYRAPSGALVFGGGTTQWSWGLDSNHDRGSGAASVPMKQATVNLFADMGVQPATLQAGLVAATASTDTTAPTTTIAAPPGGSTRAVRRRHHGLRHRDRHRRRGGRRGRGLHRRRHQLAPGHRSRRLDLRLDAGAAGPATIMARASDDSANLGAAGDVSVTVGAAVLPVQHLGRRRTPVGRRRPGRQPPTRSA